MADKILNQSQAEAVYTAMCHLNNVSASRFQSVFLGKSPMGRSTCTEVQMHYSGEVVVEMTGLAIDHREHYADQSAFATAYGLQQG